MSSQTLQLAFGAPGATELLLIFGIVIVLFGGSKLPLLGKSLGESINNFKKSFKESDDENIQVAEVESSNQTTAGQEQETPNELEDQS